MLHLSEIIVSSAIYDIGIKYIEIGSVIAYGLDCSLYYDK